METLWHLAGAFRRARSPELGPGCTCESCVQAWDRHRPVPKPASRERRRYMRLGLY